MSEQVLNASVTEYKSNIYMMLGQSEARFRNAVRFGRLWSKT